MGLGKTYSTKYLVDSNNNTGAVGEVLVSTATGINWANGSDIVGGPYLPLAGGTMTGTAGIIFPDDFKLNIGTGSDLEIYHDGSNSYINEAGTGSLFLKASDIFLKTNTSENAIACASNGAVSLYYDNAKKFETTSTGVEVTGKITNLTAGTGNLDAVNVQQLNDATTGALIFKGTWSAAPTTTSVLNGIVVSNTLIVISSPNTGISVGATITGTGISGTVTVSNIAADGITITISSVQSIADGVTLTFTTVGGIPDLSQTARKVTGDYYICETAGVATPNGTGTTPDDWAVGDWVAFSDLATDAWQKIDNSSVLSGAGTGGTVPVWAGSGTSVTLGDSPITVSGSDATFAQDITARIGNFKSPDAASSILMNLIANDGSNAATFRTTATGNVFEIKSQNSGTLKFDSTSSAFTGSVNASLDITAGSYTRVAQTTVSILSDAQQNSILKFREDNNNYGFTFGYYGSANDFILTRHDNSSTGVTVMSIPRNSNNVAFTGTVTSPTFIGDLNGTINTATTGATQTAGNNSTLIATTAYADAAAAAGGGNFLPLAGGTMTAGGTTKFPDNTFINVGTSGDAVFFHDGTNTVLRNYTGNLYIDGYSDDKDIIFRNDDGAGAMATYLTLDGSTTHAYFSNPGNVGIGTTDPSSKLTVAGTIASTYGSTNGYVALQAGTNTVQGFIEWYRPNPTRVAYMGYNDGVSANNLGLNLENSANFVINGGNVGIGTTSPDEKLDVNGNIKIQSALLSNQENTDVDTGAETVASVLKATYTAAFFDFVIKEGTNLRAGTVFACHDGTNVVYTETSTNDLGDTSDVTLSVDISGTDMRLRATVTSDDWIIKSLIRAI